MFGIDTKETLSRAHDGVAWKIGLLSDGRFEELSQRYDEAMKPLGTHLHEAHTKDGVFDSRATKHCTECRKLEQGVLPVWRDVVREGLRGCDANLPFEKESFQWAGETYEALTAATLDKLQIIRRGRLLWDLAHLILSTNQLDTNTVMGFLASSGSPTAPSS
jgi:hypothetical protein